MGKLFQQFGETVAAFTHHPVVQTLTTALTVYVVIVWLATAFWAFQDLRRRHRNPGLPYLAAAGIIIASPILFPLAVVVYRTVRPGETFFEARERELTDQLEQIAAEAAPACPGCGLLVEADWLACPECRTRLGHLCVECARVMGLDWTLCAWCGAEFGRSGLGAAARMSPAELVPVMAGHYPARDDAERPEQPSSTGAPRPNRADGRPGGGRRERHARPETAQV